MTQKINAQGLPVFSLAEQLKTEEDIAIYMGVVFEDDGLSEIAHAVDVVAKAREIGDLKKASDQTCRDSNI